jgi:hypothetical protein
MQNIPTAVVMQQHVEQVAVVVPWVTGKECAIFGDAVIQKG